jgi:hypothetical protein
VCYFDMFFFLFVCVSLLQVLPPVQKEPGFFSKYASDDIKELNLKLTDYAHNFPELASSADGSPRQACMNRVELDASGKVVDIEPFCKSYDTSNHDYITGEASATYLTQANPRFESFSFLFFFFFHVAQHTHSLKGHTSFAHQLYIISPHTRQPPASSIA